MWMYACSSSVQEVESRGSEFKVILFIVDILGQTTTCHGSSCCQYRCLAVPLASTYPTRSIITPWQANVLPVIAKCFQEGK